MSDPAVASSSIRWYTASIAASNAQVATLAYVTTLYISDLPVQTIYVLPANGGLLVGPENATLPLGVATTLQNNFVISALNSEIRFRETTVASVLTSTTTILPGQTQNPIPTPTTSTPVPGISSTTTIQSSSDQVMVDTSKEVPSSITSTTSTTTPNIPVPGRSGISVGAVVGVAIGAFAAGILLLGIIFWLGCGRRYRRIVKDSEANVLDPDSYEKGPAVGIVTPGVKNVRSFHLDGMLSQPLEDKALSGEVSKISNLIKNHVQSYYHSSLTFTTIIDLDDIEDLGSNMPLAAEKLCKLLESPKTREIALRFCIAWVIFSRVQSHGSASFLPEEVARCLHRIVESNNQNRLETLPIIFWRTLTSQLLYPRGTQSSSGIVEGQNVSTQATADTLDQVLQPFADGRLDNAQRRKNLEGIIKRSVAFALTLFAQPSSFEFEWVKSGSISPDDLCIFPALVQVVDESGQALRPPRPYSEAVIRSLDL